MTDQVNTEAQSGPEPADVVEAMIKIRKRRESRKKEFEAADKKDRELWEKGERWLLQHMQAHDISNLGIKNKYSVFYTDSLRASSGSWEDLKTFIQKTGEVDLLEHRPSSKAVKAYMDDHEGEVPPGISTYLQRKINIRNK